MDNMTKAEKGLQMFVDNWCRIEDNKELKFRCEDCSFGCKNKNCLIKVFSKEKLNTIISCMAR